MMIEPKLKPSLWIAAQIRLCDHNFMPAQVRRRGDPDGGAIVLVLDRLDGTAEVFSQARGVNGELGWMRGAGPGAVSTDKIDAYIAAQVKYDPDLWVLEIEDGKGRYVLDGKIVA